MDTSAWLISAGTLSLTIIAIWRAIASIKDKLRAERQLEKRVVSLAQRDERMRRDLLELMKTAEALRANALAEHSDEDYKLYLQAREVIFKALNEIDKKSRQVVLEGLHQPSELGRIKYASKIMEESAKQMAATV